MSAEIKTPRTDRAEVRREYGDEWGWCRSDFARQLERELAVAEAALVEIDRAPIHKLTDSYRLKFELKTARLALATLAIMRGGKQAVNGEMK